MQNENFISCLTLIILNHLIMLIPVSSLYDIDGLIILGDVATGSPAAVAGLKEGDELIGINNLIGQHLQQFKSALQVAGEKIRMIIRRDGQLIEFNFKIKSIL
jgi:predicted metalloprotease with PDZ domain